MDLPRGGKVGTGWGEMGLAHCYARIVLRQIGPVYTDNPKSVVAIRRILPMNDVLP
jgi:hypothetical protein